MSKFYDKAWDLLCAECHRLEIACAEFDADPAKKKAYIDEYKCLKSRWAAVTDLTVPFYNSHRLFTDNSEAHYMAPHIWEDLCADETMYNSFKALYEDAEEELRKDIALLFAWHAIAYKNIRKIGRQLAAADEGESIEQGEYLTGYRFALDSIRSAWKDVYDLPIQWDSPHSAVDIEHAMACVVKKMRNECIDRLAALPDHAENERKALNIVKGMYDFCINAALLHECEKQLTIIRGKSLRMPNFVGCFPKLAEVFGGADDDEKLRLTAAFYGIVWMTCEPLSQYTREYEQAKKYGDVRSEFELEIKINAISSVIKKWSNLAKNFGYGGLVEV